MLGLGIRALAFAGAALTMVTAVQAQNAAAVVSWRSSGAAAQQQAVVAPSEAQLDELLRTAIPMEKLFTSPPAGVTAGSGGTPAPGSAAADLPRVTQVGRAGNGGGGGGGSSKKLAPESEEPAGKQGGIETMTLGDPPLNYGSGNLNTTYHYNDYLNRELILGKGKLYPYSAVGRLLFQAADGFWYTCTAALISRSIAVTAGHCVHNQVNWNIQTYFFPGHHNGVVSIPTLGGTNPFKFARAVDLVTYVGWTTGNCGAGTNGLDGGCDIGLIVLSGQGGKFSKQMGDLAGFFDFCFQNCAQAFWFLTQVGYPGNYYDGNQQTISQHIESCCVVRDYRYGTGMRGGSSGGPHIANVGFISDTSSSAGQWPFRNVIFAVTSWGFIDQTIKIQGAPALANAFNSNDFRPLYNLACTSARTFWGVLTCGLL